MNLKKWKTFTSKFVGGPSSYKKIVYQAAVSQKLETTDPLHVSFSSRLDGMFAEDEGLRSCVFGLVIRSDRYRYCCQLAVSTY